jgi:hypothetical protein
VGEIATNPAIPNRLAVRQTVKMHRKAITTMMQTTQPFFDIYHPILLIEWRDYNAKLN